MLKDRIVFLGTAINDAVAESVISQLAFLESQSISAPISLYINSPGGAVESGLAILNALASLKVPVHTYCVGLAHSLAAIILAAGTRRHRYALAESEIGFSEVTGRSDLILEKSAEFAQLNANLIDRLSRLTGKDSCALGELFATGKLLTPREAVGFGVIDEVVTRRRGNQ